MEPLDKLEAVFLEEVEGDALLGQIHGLRTGAERGVEGQVTAVGAHHLHHKHSTYSDSALRACGRACAMVCVRSCVCGSENNSYNYGDAGMVPA